jgi:colicin import membrane protein
MSAVMSVDEPGGAAPAALSVLVHAGFAVVLIFGLNWQTSRPDAVVVELWSQLPPMEPARVEPKPEPKPEAKPPPKPEPKIETQPKKPDIALEREKKLPKKPEVKKEPPLKFDTTQRIREQLAQEQRSFEQRERQEVLREFAASAAPSKDAGYIDRIRTKIKSNIVLPPDIKGNPEAIFDVIQLPTGEVMSARLRQSSGHSAYDQAVERAILKSSPLPKPDPPGEVRRDLLLKFKPRE